ATEVPSRCTEIEEPQPGREGEDAAAQEVVRRPRDLLPDVFLGAGGIAASSLGDEPLRQGTCGRPDRDAPPPTLSPSPTRPAISRASVGDTPARRAAASTGSERSTSASIRGSSCEYGGSESESFWFGASSAEGSLVRVAGGMTSRSRLISRASS